MVCPDENGLKPCPFCGGTSLYLDQIGIDNAIEHFIVCRGLLLRGADRSNPRTSPPMVERKEITWTTNP